jgi:hypothetical protein
MSPIQTPCWWWSPSTLHLPTPFTLLWQCHPSLLPQPARPILIFFSLLLGKLCTLIPDSRLTLQSDLSSKVITSEKTISSTIFLYAQPIFPRDWLKILSLSPTFCSANSIINQICLDIGSFLSSLLWSVCSEAALSWSSFLVLVRWAPSHSYSFFISALMISYTF